MHAVAGLINNHVALGNVLQYERTQAWSVGVAFNKSTALPAEANIFFTNVIDNYPYSGYEFWINASGKLHVRIINDISGPNYIGVSGNTNICDGNWHVAWATYDGASTAAGVKIYLDGVLQTPTVESNTLSASIVAAGQNFYITSQQGFDATYYFNGQLKNFVLDNVVRSAVYVAAHSDPSIAPTVDGNTQLCFLFTEGAGVTANDTSGNGRNGTLTTPNMWYS